MNEELKRTLKPIASMYREKIENIINCIQKSIIKGPIVKDIDCIVKNIVEGKCSLSRFGDGELNLIWGEDIGFQKYDKKLADRLKEILGANKEKMLIAIPDVFDSLDKYSSEIDVKYWRRQLIFNRWKWYKYMNKSNTYYNAFISRPYIIYRDRANSYEKFQLVKEVWDKRDILIVEGKDSRLGIGNDLFDNCNSMKRILCPSENCFSKYDEILNCVKNNITNELVLIALGPTASVLAYDLNEGNIQAVDIGHIDIEYEWFLKGCTKKEKIYGKYTNECHHRNVEGINDLLYKEQIIDVID